MSSGCFRTWLFYLGLAEPVGALLVSLFLVSFQSLVPGALAFAGGMMVFITLDELIPTAREYGHEHYTAIGIIIGSLFVFILSGIFRDYKNGTSSCQWLPGFRENNSDHQCDEKSHSTGKNGWNCHK